MGVAVTITEGVGLALLGIIATVVWWGIRRMVDGQDVMAKELAELTVNVTRICGKMDVLTGHHDHAKAVCDERNTMNLDEHAKLELRIERWQH